MRLRQRQPLMVRRLRRKFVLTAMTALLIIVVLMISCILLIYFHQQDSRADSTLQMLLDNDGTFPDMKDPSQPDNSGGRIPGQGPRGADFDAARAIEMPFETRYFTVRLDADGNILSTDVDHIAAISSEDAESYAASAFSSGKTKGYLDGYKFADNVQDNGVTLIVFLDCNSSFSNLTQLFRISILIAGITLVLMLVLVEALSGNAVAPVVESLDKQKQFISDAGHELKTPLSVISANVDVLELTGEKNEWTKSIRNQVGRMTALVTNMLTLSRMDEAKWKDLFSRVNFSKIAQSTADTFRVVAKSREKEYTISIQEDLHVFGEQRALEQLCTLLLDNAMKYSSEHGSIVISLTEDHKKARLEVSNTCDEIPSGNLDRLFDRFYRADSSRTRIPANSGSTTATAGGFGIGLSAAREICESHGGEIRAVHDAEHIIRFIVLLPLDRNTKGKEKKTAS
ncbi:MAG: HAMP domain-containing sensor histidine kinase [Lachnospiraceae bacterium]|jgi:two-component system sensor histidine kinase CiaH